MSPDPNRLTDDQFADCFMNLLAQPPELRCEQLNKLALTNLEQAEELRSLLAAHDRHPDRFENFDAERAAELLRADEADSRPERAGEFRLHEELGRGGIGVVYRGLRQGEGFVQQAAVKLIKRGMDSDLILRRFHHERSILASLEHPNIARLIDGGMLEDGRPYFAMEYIDGTPLTGWCDRRRLTINERLRLFDQICAAVQYAHARLIVHRDLKPGNILVTDDGTVKLLDFGIAKLLDEEADAGTALTVAGMRAMTPEYAAPEQIRGDPISTATDVHALGVLLYELLTGLHPFKGHACTPEKLATAICNTSPPLPSSVVTSTLSAADSRRSRPSVLRRRLSGDLDTIVLKAMAKEPERRYASVEALAEDLLRFREGRPVKARRDSVLYRSGRFLARHRFGASAVVLVILALTGGLVAALWQASIAKTQAEQALLSKNFVVSLFTQSNPAFSAEGIQYRVVDLLRDSATRVETELSEVPPLQAELRIQIAEALLEIGMLEDAHALAERGIEQIRTLSGPDSQNLATALYVLARIEAQLGNAEGTGMAAREAIGIIDRLSAEPQQLRARLLSIQARAANLRGMYNEALLLNQRNLAERSALPESTAIGLASAHYNIATSAFLADRYNEAEAGYLKAGELLRSETGPEHPRMAHVHLGLAAARIGQGDLEQAEMALLQAERIVRLHFGSEAPTLATIQGHHGRLAHTQGRLAEAESLMAEAVELSIRLGTSSEAAHHLVRHGQILLALERNDEAAAQLAQALKLLDQPEYRDLPIHGLARVGQGLALARLGELDRGHALAQTAIERMRQNNQHTSSKFADAARLYAELLLFAEDTTQARLLLQEAASIFAALSGDDHPWTKNTRKAVELLASEQD